ncbi:phage portal protein, partial [Streptomyces scabiei]
MADAPEDLADIRRDLERGLGLIAKMTPDYVLAREMYDGTRAEQATSRAAEAIIRQAKDAPLSFAHIPVDVIADKVELASITGTGAAAKKALETWAEANDLDDESVDWIRKACMFGDYYVVTDPTGLDVDGSFTVEDIDSVGLSPLSTVRVYDKKTGRFPLYGVHVWDAGTKDQPITKAILY